MGRLRESFDALTPTQRGVLGILGSVVLVMAVIAVVVAAGTGGDDDHEVPIAGDTTAPTSTVATSTTSTTTASSTTPPSSSSTTTTTSTSTTTTTLPSLPHLRPDGIGEWDFGDPAETVLGEMLALLGDPDDDTGWVDQMENYGVCLGTTVRFVRWGSLQAFFTDGPTDWAESGRHFASYTQASLFDGPELAFQTADGLALGTPVGDVRARYGSDAVYDDELYGPVFVVDPPGPAQLWGSVSGLDPDDVIETMTGSYACGE